MIILIGFILLALGLSLGVMWAPEVLLVLRGLLPLGLLFAATIALVGGLSDRRARRLYKDATQNDPLDRKGETANTPAEEVVVS
jgi:hypothetical protein